MTSSIRIFFAVGEPSGDALGAQLIKALRDVGPPNMLFEGMGGPAMEAQGLKSLYPIADTSVMGLKEVVPKIPVILRRVRDIVDAAIISRPNLVVLIDSPDFTHRIARRLKRLAPEIPIAKYVAPQVWASRPWRARKLATFVDHLLALLPFEAAFFERYGLRTHFVGHPALERGVAPHEQEVAAFRTRYSAGGNAPLLVLLPGSRSNEIRFILPVFLDVARALKQKIPDMKFVLPTVAHVRDRVAEQLRSLPFEIALIEGEHEKLLAFRSATAALAASGTVTTELALARCPMVVAYRVGWLTAMLARPFIQVKFATLVNLVLDEGVIPEFLQDACTAKRIYPAIEALMNSSSEREKQTGRTLPALQRLGLGGEAPSRRAARAILEIVDAGDRPA